MSPVFSDIKRSRIFSDIKRSRIFSDVERSHVFSDVKRSPRLAARLESTALTKPKVKRDLFSSPTSSARRMSNRSPRRLAAHQRRVRPLRGNTFGVCKSYLLSWKATHLFLHKLNHISDSKLFYFMKCESRVRLFDLFKRYPFC